MLCQCGHLPTLLERFLLATMHFGTRYKIYVLTYISTYIAIFIDVLKEDNSCFPI